MAELHSMRSSNKSRSRNKPGNNGHNGQSNGNNNNNNQRRPMGNIVNRVFESAGPDGKVRGTPQQIIDKYQALARDAQVSGDRVAAENYLQHSEHYSRLLGEAQRQQNEQRVGQERDETPRTEEPAEQRVNGNAGAGSQGGAQREPRNDQYRQPRPVSNFGLATFEPEEQDGEFGLIATPESGEPQPRLTVPAEEYLPSEAIGGDPRDTAPVEPEVAQAEAPAPAPVTEVPAAEPPVAEAPVTETPAVPEVAAEPAAEPKPKRPRTRKKVKAEPEAAAEETAPSKDAAEAQPAE